MSVQSSFFCEWSKHTRDASQQGSISSSYASFFYNKIWAQKHFRGWPELYCHPLLSLGAWMKWLREENDPLSPNPCLQILFVLEFVEYRLKTKLNKSINIGLDDQLKALKIVWHVKCTVFWFFFFIHCPPIMKCGSSSVSFSSSSLSLLSPCLWSPLS